MFKSQLQEYAQRAGLPAPVYDVTKEGPSHGPQFTASVTICGKRYESPASFGKLKVAEHAVAEVALAALGKPETAQLHESGLLKNLLQEYAQKCKLPLPFYSVVKIGDIHSPMYTATVEIGGVYYDGGECKTKKEAEIKAARNALVAIHADSSASFLDGIEDQAVDETQASIPFEAATKPKSSMDEKPALTSVETSLESKSAMEETSAAKSAPQPKPANKRKKLFKGGEEVRKKGSAEKAVAMTPSEQADSPPSKGFGEAQVMKQEQDH